MAGSTSRCKKYPTLHAIPCDQVIQIRPKMERGCHILAASSQASLTSLYRVQKRLRRFGGDKIFPILETLSHRGNVSSHSLHCLIWKN